ncbi:hypothetical protein ACEPAF_4035 [Sanghuangporus sanghuang]
MLDEFANLDIDDEDTSHAREDRMRAAFDKSKLSYAQEQVMTEPGWFDPPLIPPPSKLLIRNIDYSLHNLYLRREYPKALALTLSQIGVEESNSFGEGREFQLVDLAIRCALKMGDNELAGRLSDKTTKKWSSNVGLATTSAKAYLSASRPRDALRAILTVLSVRGPQMTYVLILHRTLESLRNEVGDAGALDSIVSLVSAHIRHRISGGTEPAVVADEASARVWLERCAIMGDDQERLLTLLCRKSSFINDEAEKSVRTL